MACSDKQAPARRFEHGGVIDPTRNLYILFGGGRGVVGAGTGVFYNDLVCNHSLLASIITFHGVRFADEMVLHALVLHACKTLTRRLMLCKIVTTVDV